MERVGHRTAHVLHIHITQLTLLSSSGERGGARATATAALASAAIPAQNVLHQQYEIVRLDNNDDGTNKVFPHYCEVLRLDVRRGVALSVAAAALPFRAAPRLTGTGLPRRRGGLPTRRGGR